MKQVKGEPVNIKETIIGKVTKKSGFLKSKKNKVLVTDKAIKKNGYDAVIANKLINKNFIGAYNVENLDMFNENDIVTIDGNGLINIVHETNSKHNALFITGKCNSNCIMCPQPPVKEEPDRFELNMKHISLLPKDTISIGITGGEPTLIGDRLFTIMKSINKKLPHSNINLLSNGIRFENIDYAKKLANTINQNTVIDIPIYSDIDEIHNRIVGSKTFYRTIQGIYNLAKFNIKIGIRVVVHKINYNRLPQLAEFIYYNFPFVYQIAFMQMEPTGNALINIDELWIDPVDYNKELEEAVKILHFRDLHVSIYNSQLCILPEKMRKFAVKSISEWKNIYVEECEDCMLKPDCPGFFESSKKYHSRAIKSIKDLQACV
jgi:His-Xaa-Ser system radical SAM maturase HxsC